MSSRAIYAILGLLVGAVVDIAINLLAASIQKRVFLDQFGDQAMWGLAVLALLGLLVGSWLGKKLHLPVSSPSHSTTSNPHSTSSQNLETITITRLQALLSYTKLKGRGIHLSNILLLGSRVDIET